MKEIIIDATGGIMGRIASFSAKQALLGREIRIVNCNSALISGRARTTFDDYAEKRALGGWSLKGPNISRSSERIMKRAVRGMLSYKQGRGKEALKRIKCYNEVPAEFKGKEMTLMKRKLKVKAIKLKELSKELKNDGK